MRERERVGGGEGREGALFAKYSRNFHIQSFAHLFVIKRRRAPVPFLSLSLLLDRLQVGESCRSYVSIRI
jgi:hypothetical protein